MSEQIRQQDSSTLTNQPFSMHGSSISVPDAFWRSFRFFPLHFDEYCYKHWYLLVSTLVVIALGGATIYDIVHDAISSSHGLYFAQRILTSWSLIPLAVALSLSAFTFNRWRSRIPITFRTLLSKRRIGSSSHVGSIQQDYQRFLEEYQQTLLSPKRYIPIAIIMIISLFISLISTIQVLLVGNLAPFLWVTRLLAFLFLLFVAVIWGYFFGAGAWIMCITGLYIRRLTTKFDLAIQPSHPDNCGGLKKLGDFCLDMALPILVGVVLLSIWGIGATLFPNIIVDARIRAILTVAANAVLFLFTLPLAFIAFFLPLWDIHRKMVTKKEAYEDAFSDGIAQVEERLQSSLNKGAFDEAKSAKEEIEIWQMLHPHKIGYPVWPFDRRILFTFLVPQIVPIVSLIVQISQWLIH